MHTDPVRTPNRPRRVHPTWLPLLITALAAVALPPPAAANPGPGVVLAMAPPDPQGGVGQFSFLMGTPHAYEGKLRPVILGLRAQDRIAPWLFISLALEANPLPGDDRFYGANAIGPTFVVGKPLSKGPRVVLSPRVGFDGHRKDAWAVHLGMHVVLDSPLAWDGALRGFIGPRYTFRTEFEGRNDGNSPLLKTHYGLVTAGMTAHLAARVDLTVTATVPLFRIDLDDLSTRTVSPLAPTAAVQFTVHAGPLLAERAVVPAPGGAALDPSPIRNSTLLSYQSAPERWVGTMTARVPRRCPCCASTCRSCSPWPWRCGSWTTSRGSCAAPGSTRRRWGGRCSASSMRCP